MSNPTDDLQAAYRRGRADAFRSFAAELKATVAALEAEADRLCPPVLPQRAPSWPLPQGPQGGGSK
jgi:hypothetical protein